jgi:hypothetical protein
LIPSTEPAQINPAKFKVDKQPYLPFIDNLPQHPIQYEDFVPHFKLKPKKKRKIKRKLQLRTFLFKFEDNPQEVSLGNNWDLNTHFTKDDLAIKPRQLDLIEKLEFERSVGTHLFGLSMLHDYNRRKRPVKRN